MAHGGYEAVANVPDAHVVGKYHLPIMFTPPDLIAYSGRSKLWTISERFHAKLRRNLLYCIQGIMV